MSVPFKFQGLIAFGTQLLFTAVTADSENPAIASASSAIGSLASAVINSIKVSEHKDTPFERYCEIFEKVVRDSINETFETDGRDDDIIKVMDSIRFTDMQLSGNDKDAVVSVIYNALDKNGIYTENISPETISSFVNLINLKMSKAVREDEALLSLVTNIIAEEINGKVDASYNLEQDTNERVKKIQGILFSGKEDNSIGKSKDDFKNAVMEHKKYYVDKWNSRLFLHQDENDRELTLSNTYIHHDYSEIDDYSEKVISENNNDIEARVKQFIDSGNGGSLLITGAPGIGKSSLTAYLVNEYKDDDSIAVLRFRDLDNRRIYKYTVEHGNTMLYAISELFNTEAEDILDRLKGRTLILDGFDEMSEGNYNKQQLLKDVVSDIASDGRLRLIVTSRENYVNAKKAGINEHYKLEAFSDDKIREYYKKIIGNKLPADIIISNRDVIGIPAILYMAVAVGIDIGGNDTRAELYEKIFAMNGGIYDRFSMRNKPGYEKGQHPTARQKEMLNSLLSRLAFYMFEHEEKPVPEDVYIRLAKSIKDADGKRVFAEDDKRILDFPIKYLYEGNADIEFVHGSIYEYFTAEYMYLRIKSGANIKTEDDKRKYAAELSRLLKTQRISGEIMAYLKYKISSDSGMKNNQFLIDTFNLMLEKGMTCFYMLQPDRNTDIGEYEYSENILAYEQRIFVNMLEVIHIWEYEEIVRFYRSITEYVRVNNHNNIDLSKVDLSEAYLRGVYLSGARLNGANLRGADLRGADLSFAKLNGADLRGANLMLAQLWLSDLSGADLSFARLSGADLNEAKLRRADLNKVDLSEANFNELILDDK